MSERWTNTANDKGELSEPAILLAFLTLLRGKSFSCIFFLYLTYTIASK